MALVDEIEQASWAGDKDIHTIAHGADLGMLADASVNECMAEGDVFSVGAKAFADLNGKLTCRCEHEHAWAAWFVFASGAVEGIEDGQGEAGGLTRTGLRAAEEVATFEQKGYGLSLNRRRRGVGKLFEHAVEGRGEGNRREGSRCHICGIAVPRSCHQWHGGGAMRAGVLPWTIFLIDEDSKRAVSSGAAVAP